MPCGMLPTTAKPPCPLSPVSPCQASKLLALYFIVAFGSSMDIAAIQADSPRDLDYNSELVTVGLSNLATAAAGVGFTGSYIFSQTLFSMRMGVDTPLMGAIVTGGPAGCGLRVSFLLHASCLLISPAPFAVSSSPAAAELAVFAVPFNVMAFLPNFYFGGLTAWIGQDILKDWLFIAAKRISAVEYALLLATFGLVMAAGLEAGIAAGIVLAALHFAYRWGWSVHSWGARSTCVCVHADTCSCPQPLPSAALQLLAGHHDRFHCGAQPQRRRQVLSCVNTCCCSLSAGLLMLTGPIHPPCSAHL